MSDGSVQISVELRANPDINAQIAQVVSAVLAMNGEITHIGRVPAFDTPNFDTSALEKAVSGERAEVVGENSGRGRRR